MLTVKGSSPPPLCQTVKVWPNYMKGKRTLALWNRPFSRHLTVNDTWHLEEFGWERVQVSEEDLEFFIFVSLRTYLSSLSCTPCIRRLIRRRWESPSICYISFRRHDKFSTFLKIYFHSVYRRLLPARMSAPHVYSQRPGEGVVHWNWAAMWVLRIQTSSSAIAAKGPAPACWSCLCSLTHWHGRLSLVEALIQIYK